MEILLTAYFNTGLIGSLGHINVFLQLWAHLLSENLDTRPLAKKLKGTPAENFLNRDLEVGDF